MIHVLKRYEEKMTVLVYPPPPLLKREKFSLMYPNVVCLLECDEATDNKLVVKTLTFLLCCVFMLLIFGHLEAGVMW